MNFFQFFRLKHTSLCLRNLPVLKNSKNINHFWIVCYNLKGCRSSFGGCNVELFSIFGLKSIGFSLRNLPKLKNSKKKYRMLLYALFVIVCILSRAIQLPLLWWCLNRYRRIGAPLNRSSWLSKIMFTSQRCPCTINWWDSTVKRDTLKHAQERSRGLNIYKFEKFQVSWDGQGILVSEKI